MESLLEARDVWFCYKLNDYVLRGASLKINPGNLVMLIGRSGSGKTTFLKVLKGILRPERGNIRLLGKPIVGNSESTVEIAYIPQGLGIVSNLSVIHNVLIGCLARVSHLGSILGRFPREEIKKAQEIIEMLGLSSKALERVGRLSGGQKQRVAIGRALMQSPRLILADEFLSQLDPQTAIEVMEIVKDLSRRGIGILMATHDVHLIPKYADVVVTLADGRTSSQETYRGMSREELLARIYEGKLL